MNEEGAWASRLLEAVDARRLDPRDLALIHEIVLGALRWRGHLDARIEAASERPIEKLDPPVREALRIGAYQILFLDRVPAHAAVDGSVDLVLRGTMHGPRRQGRAGPERRGAGARRAASGLVNAVLRRVADEGRKAAKEPRSSQVPSEAHRPGRARRSRGPQGPGGAHAPGAAVRDVAAEFSHPHWMVERAISRFGEEEARAWLLANNAPPPLTLRPNPLHPRATSLAEALGQEGIRTEPGGLAPGALCVLEGWPTKTKLFEEGAFWIQDEASQIVPLLFPPPWIGLTADLCAAPGGKTLVLATGGEEPRAPGGAGVVSFDLHPRRLERLAAAARRIAPGRIFAVAGDLADAPPVRRESFARVLVDAPCSGTGVLRRHPEIRWRLQEAHLDVLADLQLRLLRTAFQLVRVGGAILYSVCSVEPEEGDGVIERFVRESGAEVADPRPHLPPSVRALVGEDLRLRTFTHRHRCDGFFAALMRKP